MSEPGLVVCGFADEATQVAGLAWALAGESGGLVARDGAVGRAEATIEADGDSVAVRIEGDEAKFEAELTPRSSAAALADPDGSAAPGSPSVAVCDVALKVSGAGKDRSLRCVGHFIRWTEDPADGAELLRHLAIPTADDALLVLTSKRDPGSDGHDAERVAAWLLDPEGRAAAFTEALLSTQYDDANRQTRAGLELWPTDPDAPPMRAAGTVLDGQVAEGDRVSAALLHTSAEGTTGLGSYVIWRP